MGFRFKGIFVLLLFLVKSSSVSGDNFMRQIYRQSEGFSSKKGFKLEGFQFKVIYGTSYIGCSQTCLAEWPKCASFNYLYSPGGSQRCELNTKGIDDSVENQLQKSPDAIFVHTAKVHSMVYPESCADYYKNYGVRDSGLYNVRDKNGLLFEVSCDFHTELNIVWTLIMSQSLRNRAMPAFRTKLGANVPLNENAPNWDAYRLSLARMQQLRRASTNWRITCNMAQDGIQYRDYVRGQLSDFDIINFEGSAVCKKVEYINVMGHACSVCTSAWWQNDGLAFHHDMTYDICGIRATPGATASQDVFGYYASINSNFRCSSSDDSNTNLWLGSIV